LPRPLSDQHFPFSIFHPFSLFVGPFVVVVVLLLWQQHVARLVVVVYQWQLIGDAFDDVESSGLLTSSTLS